MPTLVVSEDDYGGSDDGAVPPPPAMARQGQTRPLGRAAGKRGKRGGYGGEPNPNVYPNPNPNPIPNPNPNPNLTLTLTLTLIRRGLGRGRRGGVSAHQWRRKRGTARSGAAAGSKRPLGGAPARLVHLLRARLAAPGGSVLPGREDGPLGAQPLPQVFEPAPPKPLILPCFWPIRCCASSRTPCASPTSTPNPNPSLALLG